MRGWWSRPVVLLILLSSVLHSIPPAASPPVHIDGPSLPSSLAGPTAPPATPAKPVIVDPPPVPHPQPPPPSSPAHTPALPIQPPDLRPLPLAFVPNAGQAPDGVRFQLRALGGSAFLTDDALVLTLPASRPPDPPRESPPRPGQQVRDVPYRALRLAFVDANPAAPPRGEAPLPGTTSFLLGNDPSRWRHALPSYAGVVYPQLYPGVDLHYTGDAGLLKRTYTLAPGADPSHIRWRYTGAQDLRLDATGNLSVTLPVPTASPTATARLIPGAPTATAVLTPSTLVEQAPVAWQAVGGRRVPIAVRYVLGQDQSVGFALGAYDRTRPLTIDPVLTYSTYLGGSSNDVACGVAVDDAEAIYVVGYTYSSDFPTSTGAYTSTLAGNADVFVTKLDASGARVYSTYLGGSGSEYNPNALPAIAVNQAGEAYLTGSTTSADFPTLHAYQASYQGATDFFVTTLSAAGDGLVYSTYLGNPNDNYGAAIAVDHDGIAYIGGTSCCDNSMPAFPLRNPYQGTYGGAYADGVIVKIDPSASGNASLLYSSYLGGSGDDLIYALALDTAENIYVAGVTNSPTGGGVSFPTSAGAPQPTRGGQLDTFVAKLNTAGSQLLYGTYLGGNYDDWGEGLAVDAQEQAAVVGWTNATNFPTTPHAPQPQPAGNADLFLAQLNASGTAWRLSTYLGGSGYDEGDAVTYTRSGRMVVTGTTRSTDFPNAGDLPNYPNTSYGDALLASYDSASGQLLWSSQFGGSENEIGYALAPLPYGAVVVAGQTGGGYYGFPIVNGFQSSFGGATDAFVTVVAHDRLRADQERTQGCDCDAQKDWPFPVNTRTGNEWTRATDLAVAGTGPALSFTRTYASQSITETIGALGYGWQHLYATRVITPGVPGGEPNTIIVLSPENNRLRYAALGNGQYAAWPGVYSTLEQGSGVYTQTLRSQAQYVFDATTGRLQAIYDPQGRALSLTYNGSNQLTQVEDAADASRKLVLSYDGNGHIQSVDDGTRSVSYSYANDDLVAVTDVMGRSTSYSYRTTPSPTHLLTQITDPIGQVVERVGYDTYTVAGKVISQTLQDGSATAFAYLSASTIITTTGVDGQPLVQQIGYAGDNTMTGQTLNGQALLGSSFDDSFSPAAVVDGNGNATSTSFSAQGLPLQQTNALGQTSQALYDAHNNLLETTDPLGVTTRYRYDGQNNVISATVGITTTSPLRATTLFTYTGDSRLLEQRAPDGVVTRYAYDGQDRVISSTVGYGTPLGQTTTYGYDQFSRVVTTTLGYGTPLARLDVTRYNLDNTVQQSIQNYQDGSFTPGVPDQDVVTTYGYDHLGRTVAVTDTLGHVDLTHYDTAGRVDWTRRNAVGAQFDTNGLPMYQGYSAAAPDRNVNTIYGYDGLGRSTFVTETGILTGTFNTSTLQFSDVTTRTTRTEYDTLSRPLTVTLNYHAGWPSTADANIALYTRYDGAGNVITQTDALGRWTVQAYDALNRPVTTTLNYDDGDPLSGPADADLVSVTRYDTAGRVEQTIENYVDGVLTATDTITDRITLYQYDTLSRAITTTLNYGPALIGLNRANVTAYDPLTTRMQGQRPWRTGWVSQQYDLLGRVTTTIQNCDDGAFNPLPTGCAAFDPDYPDRNVPTTMAYDALSRTQVVTNALGVATHTTYDSLGRAIATTRNWVPGGPTSAITNVTTLTRYDGLGRTLVMTDALGYPTRSGYNGLSQTVLVTDTLGRVTRSGYDGQGTLRWSKRPDGQLTVYQLDGLGRAVATIVNYQDGVVSGGEPSDQDLIARTVYDVAGRRLATVDPAGHTTAFTYDNQDRLIAVTTNVVSGGCAAPPCNLQTQYQYDRMGNRSAIIDARGNTRSFAYNAAGWQVRATDPLGQISEWEYEGTGQVLTALDPRGSGHDRTYQYDGLQRLSEIDALEFGGIIAQYYDALGRRTISDSPGAPRETFQYDALDRLTQTDTRGAGTVAYTYDARGQRSQLDYPNGGPTLEYAYWPDGQLKVVTDTTTLASYSYDTVGRLATVTRANGAITTYTYDDADRLIDLHTTVGGSTRSREQYTLDRLGQRTAVTETLGLATRVITYTYDGLQRLTSAGESPGAIYAYAYDDAGNRTGVWVNGSQVTSQSYDAADQVVGWSYDQAGNLLSDGTTTALYDPLSRRWSTTNGGQTKYYGYDAEGMMLTETISGSTTISYTQDLAAPLAQMLQTIDGGTTTDHLYGLDRLASESGGTRTWYGADALLSVRQTLNNSGTVLGSINYDPWGQVESGTTPGFGFTGEMQDSLGMVYLRARWYNPAQGRFGVRDPFEGIVKWPQTLELYTYAVNDPVNNIDPSGNIAFFISGASAVRTPWDDPTTSMWQMAREFAPLIKGPTYMAASGTTTVNVITSKIRQHMEGDCPKDSEPVILVGYSLGARQVMEIADKLQEGMNEYHGYRYAKEVKVDLVVTIDTISLWSDNHDRLYTTKAPNVRRQINIYAQSPGFERYGVSLYNVRHVDGAENHMVTETSSSCQMPNQTDHGCIDDKTVARMSTRGHDIEFLTGTWALVRNGILDVMRLYSP